MPSVKNYQSKKFQDSSKLHHHNSKENSKAKKKAHGANENEETDKENSLVERPRRRPGREQISLDHAEQLEMTGLDDHESDSHKDSSPEKNSNRSPEPEYVAYKNHEDKDSLESELDTDQQEPHQSDHTKSSQKQKKDSKTRIEFPFSEVLRTKIPEVFDLAEAVANDWKTDGDFDDLPLPIRSPVVNSAAAFGLKQAKGIEKKLEEKGVLPMARMGLEYLKSKIKR